MGILLFFQKIKTSMNELFEQLEASNNLWIWQISSFFLLIILTFVVAKLFKRIFERAFIKSSIMENRDLTNVRFLMHFIRAVILIVGLGTAAYMIPVLRTLSTSLLAGAGILAVAVGFAAQKAIGNIISGMFIVIFKPFRVNDRITIGTDISGVVEDITLRHTVVRGFDQKRSIVPNAFISDAVVVNADLIDNDINKFLFFNVTYDTDLNKAIGIIQEIVRKHPAFKDNRTPEQVAEGVPDIPIFVIELGEYAIKLRASAWTDDLGAAFTLGVEVNKEIVERFKTEGIELAKAYRIIH